MRARDDPEPPKGAREDLTEGQVRTEGSICGPRWNADPYETSGSAAPAALMRGRGPLGLTAMRAGGGLGECRGGTRYLSNARGDTGSVPSERPFSDTSDAGAMTEGPTPSEAPLDPWMTAAGVHITV